MQITIDIEGNSGVAEQVLAELEKFKNQGVKVRMPLFSYEDEVDDAPKTKKHKNSKQTPLNNSVGDTFNKILGEYARERVNVSIGEDRMLLQKALWDRYGQ